MFWKWFPSKILYPVIWGIVLGLVLINGEDLSDYTEHAEMENAPCYVRYSPTGYQDRALFEIYVSYDCMEPYYIGYRVGHEKDLSGITYTDQFRIVGAGLFRWTGEEMIDQEVRLLTGGESECVWKRAGNKVDFTGGYHGDEIMRQIRFKIDTNYFPFTQFQDRTEFLACDSFSYVQVSTMHETAEIQDSQVIVKNDHPVECIHTKSTVFLIGGYQSKNRLEWVRGTPVDIWYSALSCITTDQGTQATCIESGETLNLKRSGDHLFNETGGRTIRYTNEDSGLGAIVSSCIIRPTKEDGLAHVFVWDHQNYSKYYRKSENLIANKGDIWESEIIVKHFNLWH